MELTRLKELLGIPKEETSRDAELLFVIDDVEETVKNYCHISKVPDGLINTCYRMSADICRAEGFGQAETPVAVASISEGDTSTSFTSRSSEIAGTLLKNYRMQLNRYRKLG